MKYQILWTDMHSNLHHEQIEKLPQWFDHVRKTMDFWPMAYYPYYMRKDETGLAVEDCYPMQEIEADWDFIQDFTNAVNQEGFPMFMGYEWQGSGEDGDHNVFFKDNHLSMKYPLRYEQLYQEYKEEDVIAIPHHLAYQLNHRGKNWETHRDDFSPFVEIYSSHGSSENDTGPIPMTRHVHMGPRTGETCVERGWELGHRYGVMASGDNHATPGVYGFGYLACLAIDNSKEAIWDAFLHKRVYGVSSDRIKLNYTINGCAMGSLIAATTMATLALHIEGSDAIDRIEIIKDNLLSDMIPHSSTWERTELGESIRFKFKVEFGWGPDRRIFPDIESKQWHGMLKVDGTLHSIEKCWSNFGQNLYHVTKDSCEFDLTSYKTTASGKWMGPSAITTEGFIFEIETKINHDVVLCVDGVEYRLSVRQLLQSSKIYALEEEAKKLNVDAFNFGEYYRSDPWWHNAYKFKTSQAVPLAGYQVHIERSIDLSDATNVRVRVWQKNGACAWSSPIFIEKECDE